MSSTRQDVRKLAEQMLREGLEPSPTKILAALGKGSASTVVDELRKWKAERAGDILLNKGQVVSTGAPPPDWAQPLLAAISRLSSELGSLRADLSKMAAALSFVETSLVKAQKDSAEALSLAYTRYEAVQKMALQGVSEARDLASYWKNIALSQKEEASAREVVFRKALTDSQRMMSELRATLSRSQEPAPSVEFRYREVNPDGTEEEPDE